MIACYCRVSSARQKTDSQKAEIGRWLAGSGIDPSSVEWYEDKETGQDLKRPAFDRLGKAIFAGAVKTVVVWKLDRISRRQRDGVNLLADWCERGVRVVVVTQQIDPSGAVGRMVASVLFGLARIGFVHEFRALGPAEVRVLLANWRPPGVMLPEDLLADAEGVAALIRITGGNFRLLERLLAQVGRILAINGLSVVTREAVEAAREVLVIGEA